MNNSAPAAAESELNQLIARCEPNCPLTFLWWTRGGEPGPGYTSDHLTITFEERRIAGAYIRARFDQTRDPPFKALQYDGDLPPAARAELMTLLVKETPFDRHMPSEDRDDLADAIKDTIQVVLAGRQFEKTLYQSNAAELAGLKAFRSKIARMLYDSQAGR